MKYTFHQRYPHCVYPIIALNPGEKGVLREAGVCSDGTNFFYVPSDGFMVEKLGFGMRRYLDIGDVLSPGKFKKLSDCSHSELRKLASVSHVPLDEILEVYQIECDERARIATVVVES